ncbi:MAG: hypothetical protein L0Z62_42420 [Gemmataceae bacterium]|nr:hypothetical protein [Gemmataceae bacterium]
MTRVLLCGGPALLVVETDRILYYRRPGQPDTRVPYAPEHYPVFLTSARHKHDLTRVVGPCNEEAPTLPPGAAIPELRFDRLSSGEVVHRMMSEEGGQGITSRIV